MGDVAGRRLLSGVPMKPTHLRNEEDVQLRRRMGLGIKELDGRKKRIKKLEKQRRDEQRLEGRAR